MLWFLLILVLADLALLVGAVWMCIAGFRVRPWWALVVLLPFGPLIFAGLHWREARGPFLTQLIAGGVLFGAILAGPDQWALVKQGRASAGLRDAAQRPSGRSPARVAHEVRDLAENEAPPAASPAAADPNAAARAAYTRNFNDASLLYQQLANERANLKPGQATVDFNVKAARYQEALRSLAAQKAQLDSLDHPAVKSPQNSVAAAAVAGSGSPRLSNAPDAESSAALDRLRLLAGKEDYPAFAALLQKCLADYRSSPAFPPMVALGRQTLSNATPAKIAAAIQRQTAAERAEMATVTREIQTIVNQVPPAVPKPAPGSNVYNTEYHPGANKPDFNTANLLSTRELQPGDYVYVKHVPGVYYRSADCEFNPQTKYFITNRDVPKKKLTDAEYGTLTQLYRILGRDEALLAAQAQQLADASRTAGELLALNTQLAGLAAK